MSVGIYKITNNINNKCYIGQSSKIEKRWTNHKVASHNINDKCYEYPLYRAIRKYGLDNFSFEIIEECLVSELDEKEIYWINYYNPEYNQIKSGKRNSGSSKLTFEQVKEIQNILINIKNNEILHKDIAIKYGVHRDTIRDINMGDSWHDDTLIYPLHKTKKDKKIFYCKDCNKEVSKGAERCSICANKYKVELSIQNLPLTRDELKNLIRTLPFTQIGKKYNVSDNCIRKWCLKLNLPSKTKEIKSYSNEEWNKI